ncbi:DapH/DapD/GlmU-related protein [Rothia nasimurium]|uniref:DapH/DapD/GlmU-related protein n=1 Tax=Rothia nasimurium TaxID=85336 RepID=UPI001F24CA3C|nr:DapH/DapD/GlmU-related protein [Rothia nasimurium]
MEKIKIYVKKNINYISSYPFVPMGLRWRVLRLSGSKGISRANIEKLNNFTGFNTSIGDGSFVNQGSYFDSSAPITIGREVGIGPRCTFLTGSHHIGPSEARIQGGGNHAPIVIEDGCWIGGNVTVLPGVVIGRGCVIAAGAVVTRDCEPNGLYAGVPARRIRDLSED